MNPVFDAFWRAAAYCLHPRVILWSLLPLLVAVGLVLGLAYLYWDGAVESLRALLNQWEAVRLFKDWVRQIGGGGFVAVVEPLIIVAVAVPLIVVLSLLLVAVMMTPAIVRLVAARRFAGLERKRGAGWLQSVSWSLAASVLALVLLTVSMPLWLIPPLVMLLPPLIWGWLTYRVMSFDALADHASAEERRAIMKEHRWPLLAMGVISGYLGAAPTVIWAAGALTLVFAPLLAAVSVWLYTVVFAFSSLWFSHYALDALQRHRAKVLPAGPGAWGGPARTPEVLPPLTSTSPTPGSGAAPLLPGSGT